MSTIFHTFEDTLTFPDNVIEIIQKLSQPQMRPLEYNVTPQVPDIDSSDSTSAATFVAEGLPDKLADLTEPIRLFSTGIAQLVSWSAEDGIGRRTMPLWYALLRTFAHAAYPTASVRFESANQRLGRCPNTLALLQWPCYVC